jgi:cytosine/adenosine deaminase-related metal-dependent hydrolase
MEHETSIVRGGWLISGSESIPNGAAVLEDGLIQEVGSWRELAARYPNARVFGSGRHLLMPGLINAHHHGGGVPQSLHGISDDTLEPWLLSTMGMRPEDAYLGTLLSAVRLLKSGVTSVVDMTVAGGSAEELRRDTEARLRAYRTAGLAAAVAPGTIRKSFLISGDGEDARFLASLPAALQRRVREMLPLAPEMKAEEYLACIVSLAEKHNEQGLQQVWFGPPGPQWNEAELLQSITSEAQRRGMRIQTHVLESFYEKLEGGRSYGKGTIERLEELGVLTPELSLAHGVWLTEREVDILAAAGTAVSHNPSSNLRLRSGTAPLNALLAAGVPMGLGLDANGLNDDDDMFTEMRMALRLHRTPGMNGEVPSPADIFGMATAGGAQLLGQARRLGRLSPGFRADAVLVNTDRILGPWREDHADPLELLLTRAKARDVDTVFVAGRPVIRGGEAVMIDEQDAEERLVQHLRETPPPDALRGLIDELKPYLRKWYREWETPGLEPYAVFNSRR